MIRRGAPVEFTRTRQSHHTLGKGEFGIAAEDSKPDGSVLVELSNGTTYQARHIHAYGWGGWIPRELEVVYDKHNPDISGFDDD